MKRCFGFFLVLALLLSLFSPAACAVPDREIEESGAEVVEIDSAAAFLSFAAECSRDVYSRGKVFSLRVDIDLSQTDFVGVPYFAGTFLGNGHTILGLNVDCDGSRMGLFRRVAPEGSIRNLNVRGSVAPGGSGIYVGGIAGVNDGSIVGCSFSGSVHGLENVGGIAGICGAAALVDRCSFSGEIVGEHQVGGIVGNNGGVVSRCASSGLVNTVAIVPQSDTHFDLALLSEDDFFDLTNIGGIAGVNDGVISACVNSGDVGYRNTGYNVGGVAGKTTGYLVGCRNSAVVNGRRDVGGVAGQLIPSETWDLSNDRLAALSGQLSSMNYLIAKAAQHAGENNEALGAELSRMQESTSTAISELEGVLRTYENNNGRIVDSIHVDPVTGAVTVDDVDLSGINTSGLTGALADMNAEAGIISDMLRTTVSDTTEDLAKVMRQMTSILGTMYSLIENVSGLDLYTSYDLSSEECYEHDIGVVSGCFNYGDVLAENNAGGIVGTMGYEISFDMEGTLNASSFLTADVARYIFAVVRDSESYCEVQTKGDAVGGVVGSMEIGAAVSCVGAGSVRSLNGSYVGGVAGSSQGTVRDCWARALLSGGSYVGGVVGEGHDLSSCRSWAHIESASEYAGAVAGWADGTVVGNLYVNEGPAGIDNVSMSGMTDPISAERFLGLESRPENLSELSVSFVAEGRTVAVVSVPFGGGIDSLPEVENDGARYWKWDDFPREHIYYSITVSGKYYTPGSTLSSGGEIPLFLVEGVFYEGQQLTVVESVSEPDEDLLAAYSLFVDGYEGDLIVHMRSEEIGKVYQIEPDGERVPVPSRVDGQYLVFTIPNGGSFVFVRALPGLNGTPWIVGGCVLAAAALFFVLRRSRKKKATAAAVSADKPATEE